MPAPDSSPTSQDLLDVYKAQRDEARNAEAVVRAHLIAANRTILAQKRTIAGFQDEAKQSDPPKPKAAPKPPRSRKLNGAAGKARTA